jgi:hypothetical protein
MAEMGLAFRQFKRWLPRTTETDPASKPARNIVDRDCAPDRPDALWVTSLAWGVVDEPGGFAMFRRAKIMFDGIPADVLPAARASGVLVGRLGLTDPKGNPTCASVRPPLIE